MRLQLHLTPNTQPVPFNHLHQLTGTIHKWLGQNDIHDGLSLYSFGWLHGGKRINDGLSFPRGAQWNVSFYDDSETRTIIAGIMKESSVAFGMRVIEFNELPTPAFGEQYCFRTDGSAIMARQYRDDKTRAYLLWDDPMINEVLTNLLRQKLVKAGFSGDDLAVRVWFDHNYNGARTRKITVKGTEHKVNECPVVVEGTPEVVRFAWLVGIGDLTGSGFGGLR